MLVFCGRDVGMRKGSLSSYLGGERLMAMVVEIGTGGVKRVV